MFQAMDSMPNRWRIWLKRPESMSLNMRRKATPAISADTSEGMKMEARNTLRSLSSFEFTSTASSVGMVIMMAMTHTVYTVLVRIAFPK